MDTEIRYHHTLLWLASALLLIAAVILPRWSLAESGAVDQEAERLLKSATDFLASQNRFSLDTSNTTEVVLENGQKIQFMQSAKLSIQRPDKLRAERHGDVLEQVFYYDGKTLTLHNPGEKVFASAPVPGSIEGMLDYARESLGVVAPAGDLVYSNAYDILMQEVVSGFVVGKSRVNGVSCDHLAFHSPYTDWQIWIQEGETPLPLKLVITSRDVFNAPQFSVVASNWNLSPNFAPGTFDFKPPEGAHAIEFLPRSDSGVEAK